MKLLQKPKVVRPKRLTLKERIARAELLVGDARINGKRSRDEAPIMKLIREKELRDRSK